MAGFEVTILGPKIAKIGVFAPANIAERKTWTQSEFCTCQTSVRGQEHPKMYSVPAQESAKRRTKYG